MIDPKVVESLVAARARAERSPLATLTPRERDVLAEIARGKSNTAIAESLVLTKRAVENHINSIFLKLNLSGAEDRPPSCSYVRLSRRRPPRSPTRGPN